MPLRLRPVLGPQRVPGLQAALLPSPAQGRGAADGLLHESLSQGLLQGDQEEERILRQVHDEGLRRVRPPPLLLQMRRRLRQLLREVHPQPPRERPRNALPEEDDLFPARDPRDLGDASECERDAAFAQNRWLLEDDLSPVSWSSKSSLGRSQETSLF